MDLKWMYDSLFKVVLEDPVQNYRNSVLLDNKTPKFNLSNDVDSPSSQDLICSSQENNLFESSSISDSLTTKIVPAKIVENFRLRSVQEIPENYRYIFSSFPYFNIIQSKVFDDALYDDKNIVVSAPTGSGKTVIFELAIIRFLMESNNSSDFKIVYMAPIKAICSERYNDWKEKFGPLGLRCIEITGDSELDDYFELQKFSIILTTPEKWDGLTRRWQNNKSFAQLVRLFMIDEIHLLNDESRGATFEAVISRMKIMQNLFPYNQQNMKKTRSENNIRFLAVSATIPNADDITSWLSSNKNGVTYKMNDNLRPVTLKRIVLGYPFHNGLSEFKFDILLSYKLGNVINTYSERKPTLVFCSTRKGVIQTASILSKERKFVFNSCHKQLLTKEANMLKDSKLRDALLCGIGFHHAGLYLVDRKIIEELFMKGQLMVLISTSTLAMGVNLPAHLVVIKSTTQYRSGIYEEYSETQIVQMIGRAGRPQYDSTAVVVIMTKQTLKTKYESLISGTQIIESSLHKNLVEHLNAEIVLHTITDVSVAMEWIHSTFLYIRIMKNPKHYGIPAQLSSEKIEKKLQEMCIRNLNALRKYNIITMDDDCFDLKPTEIGYLMAKFCLKFETMKQFSKISGNESLRDLIILLSECKEFEDIVLRSNERKILNTLNKNKTNATIRYLIAGKVNTPQLKINCIIQAAFGCLTISEASLSQDMTKIMKIGQRISKGLAEYLCLEIRGFKALLNAVILAKCFYVRLWENSKYVSRQLEKIGATFSNLLVNANITSFQDIEDMNPRELEMILNRHPPFGSYIHDATSRLPKYDIFIEQDSKTFKNCLDIYITVILKNNKLLQEKCTAFPNHSCLLLIGDCDNNLILKQRIMDSYLIKSGLWKKKFQIEIVAKNMELNINLISEYYVGLDKQMTYKPHLKELITFEQNKENQKIEIPNKSSVLNKKRNLPNNKNDNKGGQYKLFNKKFNFFKKQEGSQLMMDKFTTKTTSCFSTPSLKRIKLPIKDEWINQKIEDNSWKSDRKFSISSENTSYNVFCPLEKENDDEKAKEIFYDILQDMF